MDLEPCECGNRGHRNLWAWLDPPSEDDDDDDIDIPLVDEDELDLDEVEQEINQLLPVTITSQGYCNPCQGFTDAWPELSHRLPTKKGDPLIYRRHYESPFEVEAGERSSCRLCTLFSQGIRKDPGIEFFYKTANRLKCLKMSPAINVCIVMNRCLTLELQMEGKIVRHAIMEGLVIVQVDTSGRQGLSQLELAKSWLEECSESHDTCKGSESYRMPTRLLAVSEDVLRLVRTTNWDSAFRPQYATLSHCWGDIDFLKLTSTTVESFTRRVPSGQLTKTFRDAIAVVRGLGIPYLWIDSLCIIQDSSEDWEAEAALMDSVYGNSTVTIAATGAFNGNSGLHLQSEKYVGKVHIDVPMSNGTRGWDIARNIYDSSVTNSVLAKRAWTLQERMLSPRILHFTDKELFWECRSLLACESFPGRLPAPLSFGLRQFWHNSLSVYDKWQTVIELYTGAKLTYNSDKLVAISGIAQFAQKNKNDDYLAGMWRHAMEAQLCWRVKDGYKRPSRRETDRAPSWSWASVDAEIEPYESDWIREPGLRKEYFAHVLDASTIPIRSGSSNTFGRLRGGTLNVSSCAMLSGLIRPDVNGHRYLLVPSDTLDSGTLFCIRPSLDLKNEADGETLYLLPMIKQTKMMENEDSRMVRSGGRVLELPLGVYRDLTGNSGGFRGLKYAKSLAGEEADRQDGKDKLPWMRIAGLILRPSGGKKGEFSRVGQFAVQGQNDYTLRQFTRRLNKYGKATAESCCAEIIAEPKHPGERYLITII